MTVIVLQRSHCRYFWLNAGILLVGLGLYALIARKYEEKSQSSQHNKHGAAADDQGFKAA